MGRGEQSLMDKKTKKVLYSVVENQKKLDSCSNHDFSIKTETNHPWMTKWKCIHCDGEVDGGEKYWYELGKCHVSSEKKNK